MRFILLVTALCASLFVSACSKKGATDPNPALPRASGSANNSVSASPGGGATGAPAPIGGGVDKATVCAAYMKAQSEAEAKLTALAPRAAEAMTDPSKAPAVLGELKAALAAYEVALKAEAARTADAELRAAISADAAALTKALQDLTAAGNDVPAAFSAINTEQFTAMGEKVKTLCGK